MNYVCENCGGLIFRERPLCCNSCDGSMCEPCDKDLCEACVEALEYENEEKD
jgi:hypothetical protein